eukprot:PITA_05326
MIGGDFNSTLCNDEIWGNGRKIDPIGRMIRNAIIQNNCIDIQTERRGPTWDNGRSNDSFMAKRQSQKWQLEKSESNRRDLKDIDKELQFLSTHFKNDSISSHTQKQIWDLEKQKQKILAKEEATWRLKSHAIWLREGDKNTKFFHIFANRWRQVNTIWEIKDEAGKYFFSQEDISCEAVKFFKKAYNRDIGSGLEDILWGIDL